MSKLTLDEAIKHCLEVVEQNETQADKIGRQFIGSAMDKRATDCRECAADHRQLAEWLMELKDLRAEQNDQYVFIHELMSELKEAKRLLKAAVEDLSYGGENNKCTKSCNTCTHSSIKGYGCRYYGEYHWRYADEALALIGEDTNVPASADDTNVGHKSGGWISVNDRLPEAVEEDVNGKIAFSKSVLVYLVYDNGFTYITNDRFRVDSKSWLHEIPGEGCKVTHWQPLPEPPKDGEQNDTL